MKDDLMKLFETQKIDLEIDKLNRHKTLYPKQIEVLTKEIESAKQELKDNKALIAEKEKNSRTIEIELASERELLAAKEKRLLETKTNREYQAVQNEIEMARQRIDSLETEDLELMTELDTLNPKREELKKKHEEMEKNNSAQIKEIEEKYNSIESDLHVLEHKHKLTLHGVDTRALSSYNRLRKGKSGTAIAIVDPVKHSCRGCYKQLPPQKVLEVRRCDKILFCENCGCILIWDFQNG